MRHSRQRSGFSLLELVAVLGSLLVIGITATQVLHRIAAIGRQAVAAKNAITQTQQLSIDFRADLATIQSVDNTTSNLVELSTDSGTITYTASSLPPRIERVVMQNDKIVATETYRLTAGCEPKFQMQTNELEQKVLRLDLTGREQGNDHGYAWIIDGVVP